MTKFPPVSTNASVGSEDEDPRPVDVGIEGCPAGQTALSVSDAVTSSMTKERSSQAR